MTWAWRRETEGESAVSRPERSTASRLPGVPVPGSARPTVEVVRRSGKAGPAAAANPGPEKLSGASPPFSPAGVALTRSLSVSPCSTPAEARVSSGEITSPEATNFRMNLRSPLAPCRPGWVMAWARAGVNC